MKALILAAVLAADGGVDAPRVMQLPGGNYLFNEAAFLKVDSEMKRLQGVEREHKGESWLGVLLVGMGTGALLGVITTLTLRWLIPSPVPPAAPPSP